MACPPSWTIPASNVTRVLRLGFWNSIASVRPGSGGSACRRVATNSVLRSVAVANTRPTSSADRSATESRSRPTSGRCPDMTVMPPLYRRRRIETARPRYRSCLTLGVLRRLSSSLQAVLLALLHPWITGEEAGLAQRQAVALGVELEQGAGDAVPDRAGLAGDAAALDLDHHVEAALRSGHPERQADVGLVDRVPEMLLEGAAIDHDLALTRQQPDAGDGRLAAAGAGIEGGDRHRQRAPRQASGSGRWA